MPSAAAAVSYFILGGYKMLKLFRKKVEQPKPVSHVINGVCLGWDAKPHISFEDGTYLPSDVERIIYPQYFENGDWPTDPITKEKLPIAEV
jgi:hypothetical protein